MDPYDTQDEPPRPAVKPGQMFVAAALALIVGLAFAGAHLWLFCLLDLALAGGFGYLAITAARRRDD